MGEIAKAIAEFVKLNERTAFALFAAGVAVLLLIHLAIVGREPTEITIAYLGAFGLFIWIGYGVQKGWRFARRARQKQKRASAAIEQQNLDEARDRERALDNLGHLESDEFNVIAYLHHKGLSRVRASQHYGEFANLVTMRILEVEDRGQPYHDRFFFVPDHVRAFLEERLGQPDPTKYKKGPPWEGKDRRGGW